MRVAMFALFLFACSGGSNNTDGGMMTSDGGTSMPSGSEQLCVDTINMYRSTLKLAPYARWTDGEACAQSQAKSDSASGKAHGAFGQCSELAQNECPNWPGPPEQIVKNCLAQMWAEGPGSDFNTHGHYINMSSTQYTKVACGFFQKPDGKYWVVQDFR